MDTTRLHRLRACAAGVLCLGLLLGNAVRPASAIVYHGAPNLPLTVSLVAAGGGPAHFSSLALFKQLTGPLAAAETAKLRGQFGDAKIGTTFSIFDYAIDDTLRLVTAAKIPLPAPNPSPSDAKALSLALYSAGMTPGGKFDIGYMLEHLITHPIHHTIMHDIDYRYSPQQNATFHIVLTQMMHDLAAAYGPGGPASGATAATPAAANMSAAPAPAATPASQTSPAPAPAPAASASP